MIRPRWTLLVAASAGALCALGLTLLGAAASGPTLVANPTRGPGGTMVALAGSGFCPSCGVVEIDFASTPVKRGIAVAGNGSFSTTFMVPGGAQAGTNAINAYQQGVLVTQTAFEVTPSTAAPTGNPPTRSSPSPAASPAQSPHGTPAATPSGSSSPAAPNASGSPPLVAAAGSDPFPTGLVIVLAVLLAAVATAFIVVWWRRRVSS